MGTIQGITDQNFQTEVLHSPIPVLVDFWAPWCAPCRALAPIVEKVAEEYRDQVKVVKVNVDENPEAANRYGIHSIPTLILFVDGKAVGKIVGLANKERIVQAFRQYLEPSPSFDGCAECLSHYSKP